MVKILEMFRTVFDLFLFLFCYIPSLECPLSCSEFSPRLSQEILAIGQFQVQAFWFVCLFSLHAVGKI